MKKPYFLFLLIFSICSISYATDISLETTPKQEETVEKPLFEENMPPTDFHKTFIRMLISLGLIIILVFVTYWAFRKMMRTKQMQGNNNKAIKILERRTLSPKTVLYLVEIKNKKILLSESQLEVRSHKLLEKEESLPQKKNT